MFQVKQHEKILKNEMNKLKNEIRLLIFTDFKDVDGKKFRRCMLCDSTIGLLEKLAEFSGGRLIVEEKSIDINKDIAKKYNIKRIPTILFIDKEEKEVIRYLGNPLGAEMAPFVQSLIHFSGVRSYYQDSIIINLKHMNKSTIRLFVTLNCPYCPGVVPVVCLFAILSRGKVKAEIIDIDVNTDLAMKYNIQGVPHVIINEDQHIYGVFSPQDLMEKITKGKQELGGMYS